jgi:DNA-binding MarR family transcriptional regulator
MDEQSNAARAQILLANDAAARLEPSDAVLLELARQIYQARRDRSLLADWQDLFGEPAWDMLLCLLIASHDGRQVTAKQACAAAGVPTSTALRWLHTLGDRGIVDWETDAKDRRRHFVSISAKGLEELNRYLRFVADGHLAFIRVTPSAAQARTEKQSAPA